MQDDLIKQAMALLVEDDSDASTIASAATSLMRSLYDELDSLVGAQAANALCVHALHRTRSIIHWTLPPTATIDGTTLLALRNDLAARTPQEALFASTTVLVALVDHLTSLIGASLIHRMLSSAWNLPATEKTLRENSND
jgi:hypothetical protein